MSRLKALCERAADEQAVGCPAAGCEHEADSMDALMPHIDSHDPILRWAEQQQLVGAE